MKPKILITIEGGVIQNVDSNTDIDIVTIEYNIDDELEPIAIHRGPQDNLFKNGEAYKYADEDEVIDYLKKEKF